METKNIFICVNNIRIKTHRKSSKNFTNTTATFRIYTTDSGLSADTKLMHALGF